MKITTTLRAVCVLALLALVAAACGDDDSEGNASADVNTETATGADGADGMEALVAAAQEEGELVFYSAATDEMNEAVTKAFTDKYGISVQVLRIATGGLLERFASEQSAGVASADVLNVATHEVFGEEPDWFVPFDEDLLPDLGDYPEDGLGENYATLAISPAVITYNTDLVPEDEVPTGWEDMTDPKWKGKILLTDPRTTPTYMGWAELMRRLYGVEYLEALAEQDFALAESATPGAQQVAAGAYHFNFPAAPAHSASLRAEGAPLGIIHVQEGTNGPAQEQGIVANAPHPNAARLFMNFTLSQEAAEVTCAAAEVAVPREDVEGCLDLPADWAPTIFEVWQDPEAEAVLLGALGLGG